VKRDAWLRGAVSGALEWAGCVGGGVGALWTSAWEMRGCAAVVYGSNEMQMESRWVGEWGQWASGGASARVVCRNAWLLTVRVACQRPSPPSDIMSTGTSSSVIKKSFARLILLHCV
jgi:hypothetical protein